MIKQIEENVLQDVFSNPKNNFHNKLQNRKHARNNEITVNGIILKEISLIK